MKNKFIKLFKSFSLLFWFMIFFSVHAIFLKAEASKSSENKTSKAVNMKSQTNDSYSFRPLLIQGKKRLIQKAKDMKLEAGNISESKLFFVDINFQKRIFEDEGIE